MKFMNQIKSHFVGFLREEDGVGVVELILILVEKYFISYSL